MTYRMFDTQTWQDPWFESLSPKAKLLFIYLWTNGICNQAGMYQISQKRIEFEVGFKIDDAMEELKDKVFWDKKRDIIWVKNFFKWQCQNRKFAIAALNSISKLPEDLIAQFVAYNRNLIEKYNIELSRYGIDTLSIGYPNSIDTHALSETETVTKNNINTTPNSIKKILSSNNTPPNNNIPSSQLDSCDKQSELKGESENSSLRKENKSSKASDDTPPLEENKPPVEEKNVPSRSTSTTKPKRKSKTFSEDSKEYQLAKLLLDCIFEHRPNFKRPNLQSWAKHIDLMIRVDKRSPEEIEEVIRWCQKDTFWQANILSTQKLREKFDQLAIKMQKQKDPINFLKGFKGMDLTEEEKKLIGKVSPITIQNLRAAKRWLERTTKKEEGNNGRKIQG